jgi:hypothetical protein
MNHSEFDRTTAVVEDALRTLPLTPVPATLRSRVMRRVRKSAAAPTFAFPWLEGAISLMLATLLTGAAYLLLGVRPATMFLLTQSVRLFFLNPANRPVLLAAVPMAGMLAGCCLLTAWVLRPRKRAGARIAAAR